jgi:release factor glutamine methyltransferase
MSDSTETVRAALATGARRLGSRHEAELLLMHALGVDRAWLFMHADAVLDSDAAARLEALLARRESGEPVAYMLGRRGFWTLDLEVGPATLIPRPETELLVELALERLPPDRPLRVADLGTGSGAIALAIASERPRLQVVATDASAEALAVARRNAERLGIGNVQFAQGDWFEPLGSDTFDLIVSNPPYIEADDPHLQQGDLRFEPATALASGADGLDAIRRIAADASSHLRPDGWLLLEHGWNQGDAVRRLLSAAGYREVVTCRDIERRDRVTGGCVAPDDSAREQEG